MRIPSDDQVARFVSRWMPAALAVPLLAAGGALAVLRVGLVGATGAVLLATGVMFLGIAGLCAAGMRRLARRDRERHAAEDRIRDSEAQLRAIIHSATEAIITTDEDHRITLFNEAAEATFRCPAAEAMGEPLDRFIPERGDRRGVRGRRCTGEEFPIEARISRVTVGGRCLSTVIVRDVTQRRRAEAERERLLAAEQAARAEAEAANRSKDEFLAMVSHELRTPLTPVLAWLRILQDQPHDATTGRAYEIIERNVRAQVQLVSDLLDVSRIISGKLVVPLHPIDLSGVVDAALDSVRPSAEAKGVRLVRTVTTRPPAVLGNPDRLQQVVWNLLANAIKFTPRDGNVEVALHAVDGDVEIAVRDTGKGVSPAFLPYVFERFRQADSGSTRTHGGLGLGLAIVRHLVEQHGGSVRADSPGEGRGATFTVRLPAIPADAVLLPPRPDARANASRAGTNRLLAGRRILVVDDEPDTLVTLASLFAGSGAHVETAGSAAEAIDVLERWHPDLLISDIGMPGEDGYALIRKVRELPPDRGGRVPALALTAYARSEDRARALSAGFQTYVPKPVEPGELIAMAGTLTEADGSPD